jgi:hypothetical protein
LDESIRSGGTIDLVRLRVEEYLRELGVERLETPEILEAFDIVGDVEGDIEVLEAAIVERGDDGRSSTLKVGKARRTARSSVLDGSGLEAAIDASEGSGDVPHGVGDSIVNIERSRRGWSRVLLSVISLVFVAIVALFTRACIDKESEPAPAEITTTTVVSGKGDN